MTSDVRAALEAGDDGFHEIQLNGKQLVFLGMATTLVSVVIFLCGVLVGRGVKPLDTVAQAAGPQAFDAPVTPSVSPGAITALAATPAPATPPPTGSASGSGSGSGTAVAAAAAADAAPGDTEPTPLGDDAESPAPVAATAAAAAPKGAPPSPAAAIAPPPAPKLAAAAPKLTVPAPAKPEAREPAKPAKPAPAQVTATPPATRPTPAPAVTPAPAPTPAPAMAATAPATAGSKIAVQVGAFKTRNEADALARRLSGRGYAVYVMAPTSDGKNVFRVRVGNYATADEAQRVSAKLTSQEKLKPWITR